MTPAEFQKQAWRTCKNLSTYEKDIAHMKFGLLTEAGEFVDQIKKCLAYGKELDYVNLQEEWGDFMWYVANMHTIMAEMYSLTGDEYYTFEETFEKFTKLVKGGLTEEPITTKEQVLDIMVTIMNGYYTTNLPTPYDNYRYMFLFTDYLGGHEKLFQMNIDKLRKRYPEKFEEHQALVRDLVGEREVLENANNNQ